MRDIEGIHRISLLLVITGLTAIYSSSVIFEPAQVSPAEVGKSHLGEAVRVSGQVRDLSQSEDALFFDLSGESRSLRAVYFGPDLDIEEGQRYTFEGRVDIYQGELELVVDRVVS